MMPRLLNKIKTAMTDSGNSRYISFEYLLYLISFGYYGAITFRQACYRHGLIKARQLPCTVISIGNLTVGGTGKTPMTMYVAEMVRQLGYKTTVISRGYKGGAEKTGGIVSDGRRLCMTPETAGDEPYMMAKRLKKIPVLVGENRFAAGMTAVQSFNPDVIVLDDGFQHLALKRDLDLVLLDTRRPFGNQCLFPRGTLREPVFALSRGDAFIMTRSDFGAAETFDQIRKQVHPKPVFRSGHIPKICRVINNDPDAIQDKSNHSFDYDLEALKKYRIFAFSGLARNDDFQKMLRRLGYDIIDFIGFPDHHLYSDQELADLLNSLKDAGCDMAVTTEKDMVRIAHRIKWPLNVVAMGVEPAFNDDRDAFHHFIKRRLSEINAKRKG